MAKPVLPLTDKQVSSAKSREKNYKQGDGWELYLLVRSEEEKYWRLDYRFVGKRKTFALGVYSEVSLRGAVCQALNVKYLQMK